MEGFIKIARVAVTEHVGNHLNRKFRVFEQQAGFLHALFEEKLGNVLPVFLWRYEDM